MWEALRNRRPALIKSTEDRLWRALIDISSTPTPLSSILTVALGDIRGMISNDFLACQPHWFRAGQFKPVHFLINGDNQFIDVGVYEAQEQSPVAPPTATLASSALRSSPKNRKKTETGPDCDRFKPDHQSQFSSVTVQSRFRLYHFTYLSKPVKTGRDRS